jgi:hypothetical protein
MKTLKENTSMTRRNLPARFGLTVLAGLLAVFALISVTPAPKVHAAGASLSHPSVNCPGGANATVAFAWQQISGVTAQYLDLSVQDGSFAKDTFAGTQVNGGSFTWGGLQAGAIHWWRLNSNTAAGWQPSATGTFVPCGNPQPLTVNATCANADTANVDFFWAPMAGPNGIQYIDISTNDAFSAGFQGAGPLNSGVNSYKWANVKANQTWYYRINQRQNDGTWKASPIKSFQTRCGSASNGAAAQTTGASLTLNNVQINPNMYGSNDKLYIPGVRTGDRCGSQAPVNVRDVPATAQLGDPANDCDVVRYDFKLFPGYGGYPGDGTSAAVMAGHVDYSLRREGQSGAVLGVGSGWSGMGNGQEIHFIRADGKVIKYKVSWVRNAALGGDFDYGSLARQSNQETLALITCGGTFSNGEYDQRWVVFAVRSE